MLQNETLAGLFILVWYLLIGLGFAKQACRAKDIDRDGSIVPIIIFWPIIQPLVVMLADWEK